MGYQPSQPTGPSEQDLKAIYDRIRKGDIAPVYLVHGEDDYKRAQFAKNLARWIIPEGERDLSLVTLEGPEATAGRILEELESGSLGFCDVGRKVVLVRDTALLGAKPPGGRDALAPLTRRLEAGLGEGITLVLEAAGQADARAKLTKVISECGVVLEFPLVKGPAAAQAFVIDRLRRAGARAERTAIDYLLAVCPEDPRQLANEVTKLVTYAGGDPITEQMVREIVSVSRTSVVFDLVDAIAERRVERALQLVRELLGHGESAVWIASLLAGRFRMLYQARLLTDRIPAVAQLARSQRYPYQFAERLKRAVPVEVAECFPEDKQGSLLKQHPFVAYKSLAAALAFSAAELTGAMDRLLTLDFALKTTTGLEDAALLELAVTDLCSGGKIGAEAVMLRSIR